MNYIEINKNLWNKKTAWHYESEFYDNDSFIQGRDSLNPIEIELLGDINGKRILHLQCHFGLDTLSWAWRGAICTGVDISPAAIGQARDLAQRARIDAEFVCSDVYGFGEGSAGPYDIVYTSYGAICWLPDLDKWAEVVVSNLAPGGLFYMVEFHPIHDLLAGYSYFTQAEPDVEEEGTYTENGADVITKMAVWAHPLASVINALVGAGIRVERLNEFPFSPYNCFEGLVEREPGRFYLSHRGHDVPMVYSLAGRKVA